MVLFFTSMDHWPQRKATDIYSQKNLFMTSLCIPIVHRLLFKIKKEIANVMNGQHFMQQTTKTYINWNWVIQSRAVVLGIAGKRDISCQSSLRNHFYLKFHWEIIATVKIFNFLCSFDVSLCFCKLNTFAVPSCWSFRFFKFWWWCNHDCPKVFH